MHSNILHVNKSRAGMCFSYLVGLGGRADKLLHSPLNEYAFLDVLPEKKAGWGCVQKVIYLLIIYLNKWTLAKETLQLAGLGREE